MSKPCGCNVAQDYSTVEWCPVAREIWKRIEAAFEAGDIAAHNEASRELAEHMKGAK